MLRFEEGTVQSQSLCRRVEQGLCQLKCPQVAGVEGALAVKWLDWTVLKLYSVLGNSRGALRLRGRTRPERFHSPRRWTFSFLPCGGGQRVVHTLTAGAHCDKATQVTERLRNWKWVHTAARHA